MSSPIRHLVYSSIAPPNLNDLEIAKILEVSRKNNAAAGLTGLLLFRSRRFVQLLEGQPSKVETRFQKIAQDGRHSWVRVLTDFESPAHIFPSWQMGHLKDPLSSDGLIRELDEILRKPLPSSEDQKQQVIALFRAVAKTQLDPHS